MGHIYMLTSPSGKIYIGQTIRPIHKRLEEHESGRNVGCRAIYNAIQYHGWENFEKDWYECSDEDLNKHEELMIEVLGTLAPGGYNLKEGGANGKHSEESKQKMSESQRGENNGMYGKIHGDKTRQKIGDSQSGKIHTDETKQKMSESKTGEKNHMWGKTPSEETIRKNREAHIGKTHTEVTRQKMRESKTGEKNIMHGKSHTEEAIQKMSEMKMGDKNSCSKRVYQYYLDGKYIQSFGSCGEAGLNLEKDSSLISKCARGERKTAYGFKWLYVQNVK